ncbi:SANT/Myb_domain [Hexamita inflata]|uniref:SANT/Myb domain n=1 Tax=Hexamita inflata TaxID=28002 RepID=A0AA86QVR9_9EUKA|nr:SANT/Myb domain [Hexamita inflata]CAI9965535.1 SANT/Myb domain [Hexamita inflata]
MDVFNKQLQSVYLLTQIEELQKQILDLKTQRSSKTQQPALESKTKRSRWTSQEDQKLLQLVKKHGVRSYAFLAEQMQDKLPDQVYFKIRYLKQLYQNSKEDSRVCNQYKDWFSFLSQCM